MRLGKRFSQIKSGQNDQLKLITRKSTFRDNSLMQTSLNKQLSKIKKTEHERFAMYLNPLKKKSTMNKHPNFLDLSDANRELVK